MLVAIQLPIEVRVFPMSRETRDANESFTVGGALLCRANSCVVPETGNEASSNDTRTNTASKRACFQFDFFELPLTGCLCVPLIMIALRESNIFEERGISEEHTSE